MHTFGRLFCGLSLLPLALLAGCGPDPMPFNLVPVHGKVVYDDGSLIKTGSMTVTFNPIDAAPVGKMTPPGAQASVNVEDGTFSEVTTRRPGDGVLLGRHKVVVISFNPRADGRPVVSNAVPAKYRKAASTPLEIEVTEPNQLVEIKVSKR